MTPAEHVAAAVEEITRRVEAVERLADERGTGRVAQRLDHIERRLDQVMGLLEGLGGQKLARAKPLDPAALTALVDGIVARATANGHELGPWTMPPTLERPAFAVCRRGGCGAIASVGLLGELGEPSGACRGTTSAPAKPSPAPPKAAPPAAAPPHERQTAPAPPPRPRAFTPTVHRFKPKPCGNCGKEFKPTGPNCPRCPKCRKAAA